MMKAVQVNSIDCGPHVLVDSLVLNRVSQLSADDYEEIKRLLPLMAEGDQAAFDRSVEILNRGHTVMIRLTSDNVAKVSVAGLNEEGLLDGVQ